MKWRGREGSKNVRSSSGGRGSSGSSGMPIPGGLIGGGGGLLGVILLVLMMFLGGGGGGILNPDNQNIDTGQKEDYIEQDYKANEIGKDGEGDPKTEGEMRQYLSVVLRDTEVVWDRIFTEAGGAYEMPVLHTFEDYVQTACGGADKQVGPFYCPMDETVYIDLEFYQQLQSRFGASGDFTMAYVLSHEVGHHVQHQLGILEEVQRLQQRMSEKERNGMNVRLELQADYLAGVIAHWQYKEGNLMEGDIGEATSAAAAIGDDTIQEQAQGYSRPDTFTHGTSAQRKHWYEMGFKYGDLDHGDTFNVPESELYMPEGLWELNFSLFVPEQFK